MLHSVQGNDGGFTGLKPFERAISRCHPFSSVHLDRCGGFSGTDRFDQLPARNRAERATDPSPLLAADHHLCSDFKLQVRRGPYLVYTHLQSAYSWLAKLPPRRIWARGPDSKYRLAVVVSQTRLIAWHPTPSGTVKLSRGHPDFIHSRLTQRQNP